MSSDPWTIRRVVRWSADDFAQRGLASPRLEAEVLVAHALGVDRVKLYMDLERELAADELTKIRELVVRRRKREPVAYLVGQREFFGRMFAVTPATLIPRPDTETLVELALARIDERAASPGARDADEPDGAVRELAYGETSIVPVEAAAEGGAEAEDAQLRAAALALRDRRTRRAEQTAERSRVRVLDLGTGTGCIGLTLACERRNVEITLVDVSSAALAVATRNYEALASKNALEGRVTLLEGDLFAPLPHDARFELVVSNPPYLAQRELDETEPDVRDHEPSSALVGGPRGDEVIERLVVDAPRWLVPGGRLLVEIGLDQGPSVARIFERAGFADVVVHKDLGERDRVVEGVLRAR